MGQKTGMKRGEEIKLKKEARRNRRRDSRRWKKEVMQKGRKEAYGILKGRTYCR